ncbi:MAG: sugar ABC transporter permease [Acholeplasmataceae bacterium]|nr:sugar ABC transporter permease [Acholeplasmataceae bacterium]
MKLFSILKSIASAVVWGFGQLLNMQFLKALFFFIVFAGFIGIELSTSSYFEETSAYDKLIGEDYGDYYYQEIFMSYYNTANGTQSLGYEAFDEYLTEIGGQGNLTESLFIDFLAHDLITNNEPRFTELDGFMGNNPTIVDADDMATLDQVHLSRRGTLYRDAEGIYYKERTVKQEDGTNKKEYVETTILTDELNEENIKFSTDGMIVFTKESTVYDDNGDFFLKVTVDGSNRYLNLMTEEIVESVDTDDEIDITGPLYKIEGVIYEYYEAGLTYNSVIMQYEGTVFTDLFRQVNYYTYTLPRNQYTNRDFNRLLIKVHLAMNPDIRSVFESQYNNFFYDKAGFFIRSYWSVTTLGVAQKINFTGHMALYDSMVGSPRGDAYYMDGLPDITISEDVPVQGHTSTIILLEGLIGVILSFFFFIFMIWSVTDAYRTAEAKRQEKKVLGDRAYFKDVYESMFEYIILSPAMFVLAFISIMPIMFGFVISFTSISGNESMVATFDWVGLKNFIALFNFSSGLGSSFGQAFWRVLGWTVIWAVLSTATVFFGGFFQALVLNSEKVVFRKLWRTVLILPWAIPALLSQMVFSVMFNEFGFINTFFQEIGIYDILHNVGMLGVEFNDLSGIRTLLYLGKDNIQWFSNPFNPTFVRATLIVVNIWLGFPYFMALMTGVMTAIDKTLYEAADIDGASKWQKIKSITMPLVLYSTAPILIMTFSGNFNNFGVIYFITGGGPNAGHYARGFAGDTDILISWMYKLTVDEAIFNMASVFSVLIFLFVGSLTAWNLSKTRAFQED